MVKKVLLFILISIILLSVSFAQYPVKEVMRPFVFHDLRHSGYVNVFGIDVVNLGSLMGEAKYLVLYTDRSPYVVRILYDIYDELGTKIASGTLPSGDTIPYIALGNEHIYLYGTPKIGFITRYYCYLYFHILNITSLFQPPLDYKIISVPTGCRMDIAHQVFSLTSAQKAVYGDKYITNTNVTPVILEKNNLYWDFYDLESGATFSPQVIDITTGISDLRRLYLIDMGGRCFYYSDCFVHIIYEGRTTQNNNYLGIYVREIHKGLFGWEFRDKGLIGFETAEGFQFAMSGITWWDYYNEPDLADKLYLKLSNGVIFWEQFRLEQPIFIIYNEGLVNSRDDSNPLSRPITLFCCSMPRVDVNVSNPLDLYYNFSLPVSYRNITKELFFSVYRTGTVGDCGFSSFFELFNETGSVIVSSGSFSGVPTYTIWKASLPPYDNSTNFTFHIRISCGSGSGYIYFDNFVVTTDISMYLAYGKQDLHITPSITPAGLTYFLYTHYDSSFPVVFLGGTNMLGIQVPQYACICSDWTYIGCINATHEAYVRSCTPTGCAPEQNAIPNATCGAGAPPPPAPPTIPPPPPNPSVANASAISVIPSKLELAWRERFKIRAYIESRADATYNYTIGMSIGIYNINETITLYGEQYPGHIITPCNLNCYTDCSARPCPYMEGWRFVVIEPGVIGYVEREFEIPTYFPLNRSYDVAVGVWSGNPPNIVRLSTTYFKNVFNVTREKTPEQEAIENVVTGMNTAIDFISAAFNIPPSLARNVIWGLIIIIIDIAIAYISRSGLAVGIITILLVFIGSLIGWLPIWVMVVFIIVAGFIITLMIRGAF